MRLGQAVAQARAHLDADRAQVVERLLVQHVIERALRRKFALQELLRIERRLWHILRQLVHERMEHEAVDARADARRNRRRQIRRQRAVLAAATPHRQLRRRVPARHVARQLRARRVVPKAVVDAHVPLPAELLGECRRHVDEQRHVDVVVVRMPVALLVQQADEARDLSVELLEALAARRQQQRHARVLAEHRADLRPRRRLWGL